MTSLARIPQFLTQDLWTIDPSSVPMLQRIGIHALRLAIAVAMEFRHRLLDARAAGLVYTTLLSLVPFLAVMFSVLKAFGVHQQIQPVLAQALEPLKRVSGLVFVGFPLHPAGRPSIDRAAHLGDIAVPMLFLQGTRDELADLALLRSVVVPLGPRASLQVIDDADHSFHVRRSSGRDDAQVREAMVDSIAQWLASVSAGK